MSRRSCTRRNGSPLRDSGSAQGRREPDVQGARGAGPRSCRDRRERRRRAEPRAHDPPAASLAFRAGVPPRRLRPPVAAFRRGGRATSIRPGPRRARPRAAERPRHRPAEGAPTARGGRAGRRHAPPTGRAFRSRRRASLGGGAAARSPASRERTPSVRPAPGQGTSSPVDMNSGPGQAPLLGAGA